MERCKLYLKQGKEKSIHRKHPWVFSGAINKIVGNPSEGDLVDIYDCQKQYLATGHYQNESIIAKILQFGNNIIDYKFWKERFAQAIDYRRRFGFFDNPNTDNKLAMTTTYKCNEWLDEQDLALFEDMRVNRPKRYKVAGLGDWGIIEGVVYENWIEQVFDIEEIKKINGIETVFGLDFGYTNDPTALFCGFVDKSSKTIWVFDEFYEKGMSNEKIANKIIEMGYGKEKIIADSAEVKSIDRLYDLGLKGIRKARKGKDSIRNGINTVQEFKIIIHPRCSNFITEISNYIWDEDKFGNKINDPVDDFNHLMDAMRYALERINKGDTFSFD